MSDMTLKNTKAEILDALNAALVREKEAKRVKANPVAEEKKKKALLWNQPKKQSNRTFFPKS